MTTKDDIISNLEAWQKARAKSKVYKDISDLVVKYNDKLGRQLNDAIRKYERIKKSGKADNALYRAIDEKQVLKHQGSEARSFCIDFLQLSIDVLEAQDKAQNQFRQESHDASDRLTQAVDNLAQQVNELAASQQALVESFDELEAETKREA